MEYVAAQTRSVEEHERRIANPLPLGMLAFAFTTALIGASFAHFLVPMLRIGLGVTVGSALFFGGLIQLLAGMWEFRRNNTSHATIFSAYAGFLMAFGALFLPIFGLGSLLGIDNLAVNHAIGLLLLCWTICSVVLFLGILGTNLLLGLVMGLLSLGFLFLTIGQLANGNFVLLAIGGSIMMICSLVAWYMALAGMLRATGLRQTSGPSDTSMRETGYAGY